jgi:hypothetical protein
MSKIPLKYNKKVLFYTKIHTLRLSVGGRTDARMDGRTDGRTENIYSIFRDKLLLRGEHVFSHQQGINGFKSPKRFLEISSRDLTSFLLQLI